MHEGNFRSWLIWFVAGLFYLFEFIHRVIIGSFAPELIQSFNVSSAVLSNLSAAYFFSYAFMQIPAGLLIDHYGNRSILTIACLAITISSAIFALTTNINVANLTRWVIGIGSAFAFVGCLKLAANWFPAHKFAFVVGLTNLLGVMGALIGGAPMAYAVESVSWRSIMLGSAGVGLLLTITLWSIVRDAASKKNSHLWQNLSLVVKNHQTWLIAIFAGCMVAPIVTYSELWGTSFLINKYHLAKPYAAHISALTFIGIAFGSPIIGWLSDYYRQRTFFMGFGLLGAFSAISLILFVPVLPMWLLALVHAIFGFCSSSMLLCFSLNSEATLPKVRATTVAITNSVTMISGALLQSVSGYLLDFTQHDYNLSFIPLLSCYFVALLCFRFIQELPCRFNNET